MTKYQPLWQQAGSYAASVDRGLLGSLWPAGGVSGAAVAAVANTMQVQAQPGTVAVVMQAGQGVELCRWDAVGDSTVTLSAAPPSGQSRIDVYCVQVRDNAVDAGGNNDFIFSAVAGTPAASNPTTPATPANALALANITVPGAAANLNAATITTVAVPLSTAGAWQSYTPVWSTPSSPQPAPGTGGLVAGSYMREGKRLSLRAGILIGSTGYNAGNGQWSLGLPPGCVLASAATPAWQQVPLSCSQGGLGAGAMLQGLAMNSPGQTNLGLWTSTSGANAVLGAVGATNPYASWVAGQNLVIQGVLEIQ
jgi:hypothetical protein